MSVAIQQFPYPRGCTCPTTPVDASGWVVQTLNMHCIIYTMFSPILTGSSRMTQMCWTKGVIHVPGQDQVGQCEILSRYSDSTQFKTHELLFLGFPFNIFRPQLTCGQLKPWKAKPWIRGGPLYQFCHWSMRASHRQSHQWIVWLYSSKALFTHMCIGLDLVHRL